MKLYYDTLRGRQITFAYADTADSLGEIAAFVRLTILLNKPLGIDTESTGLNCYHPDWHLRMVQIGNGNVAYVIPARFTEFIAWLMRRDVKWLGHNGPHDVRSIDAHLGYETGVVCAGETFIPAHHHDSRNAQEGGISHGLKEQAIAYVDPDAGKWEIELKRVFKTIEVPIPGEVYKSDPRKGKPKVRKARLEEGWGLIDPEHPAYIKYAGADPILTYHLWHHYKSVVQSQRELYQFDKRVQQAADRLQRRAIKLDVRYTEWLSQRYTSEAAKCIEKALSYGCKNINSGQQIAETLQRLGVHLTERTPPTGRFPEGQLKTSDDVLRQLIADPLTSPTVADFIRSVLVAKQMTKRRESYADAMLAERDVNDRIHPSINILGAVTSRMSVSKPPLQQLPTKDRDDEEGLGE